MFNMGDQVLIKTIDPQKKRIIMPDVILCTKNVMIPIVKPVPFKLSFNISFFKDKPQILKAYNYKNNPALLFPKTASYNPLENLVEVNKMKYWKPKNQSTKYTISGKTDSPSIKKISISQNSFSSKKFFCEKRNNTSHFPNIMFEQFAPLTSNKDLCKASSKSIKLSRKYNLSQVKEGQIKYEDKFALVPRIETPISISKSPVSLSSQSFHDCTDTVSTVSTLSASSFKIENKKTFANIERKSVPRIVSQHLYPSNSEYELNVTHYENDVLSGANFPHSLQSHLKSANTNLSPMDDSSLAKIKTKNGNIINKKSAMKNHQQETDSTICDIKYSCEIDDQVPFFQRKKCDNTYRMKDVKIFNRKPYNCEIKYSWQVIGTSTQTSHTLLQNLLNNINTENHNPAYKMCSIKYSWQIIGTSTQVSLHDYNDPDYWSGILLTSNKNYSENSSQINDETDCTKLQDSGKYPEERLKKYLTLNNQQTQTFAEKEIQANPIDCYAKYSWHKLIKEYL